MNKNSNKLNPFEYLFWLYVNFLGLFFLGFLMSVLIGVFGEREIKTILIFTVTVTAGSLLFAVYRKHLRKKKESTVVVDRLEVQKKLYSLFLRLRIMSGHSRLYHRFYNIVGDS